MDRSIARRLTFVAVLTSAIAVAQWAGWLYPLDNALTDLRFAATQRAPGGNIVVVDIDSKSLARIGTWPWPRRLYADVINRLTDAEVAQIAFDIDFGAASTPADDAAFEAALSSAAGSVILPAFDQKMTATSGINHNRPLARFAQHTWVASVNVLLDTDGIVRRLGYGERTNGETLPSLAALYGGGVARTDSDFRIDFGIDAGKIDRIPLIDVLEGRVAKSSLKGKQIIIGAEAVELRDYFVVPAHGVISGGLLQALGAESIAAGRALKRTGDLITLMGLGAVAIFALCLWRQNWTSALATFAVTSLAVEGAAVVVQRIWPLEIATAAWQSALISFALVALLREIDFRRILLAISRTKTDNVQTILDRVVEDNFAGVLVIDVEGRVLAASRCSGDILSIKEAMVGALAKQILPPELSAAVTQAFAETGPEPGPCELVYWRADERIILEYVATPSGLRGGLDETGNARQDTQVVCLTFVDITERRRTADRLAFLARFDILTGLPNRNHFVERLEQAQKESEGREQVAVLCIDLDRFKTINDTLGRALGDTLLVAIGQRLKQFAGTDDFVARLAGDKFAVLLTGPNSDDRAKSLAGRLLGAVEEPYRLQGHRFVMAMSAGMAGVASGDTDPLAVLKQADTALSHAIAKGGNCFELFDPAMIVGLKERQMLELELWGAFERREFELYYQPQVNLETGHLIGAETLIRWRHPERGLILPSVFIPVIEASGLMEPIGRWILDTAAAAAATWPDEICVAVNLSPAQFIRGNLVETVQRALQKSGLPAKRLELEITESLFLQSNSTIRGTLDSLVATGVKLALDDFGTGYSSLGYIRDFPVDKIKIDRSFVVDIPSNQGSVAIVRAVSAMAEGLGLGLIAEGIESPEQVKLLRLLGCDEGQGYLFGKPMPASDFQALIERMDSLPVEKNVA